MILSVRLHYVMMLHSAILLRNKYKKAMKKVLRYCVELEHYDKQPDSHQQVMDEIKPMLDEVRDGSPSY